MIDLEDVRLITPVLAVVASKRRLPVGQVNAASRLHPIAPVTGSSLRVGNRDDHDFVLGGDVDDLIGKSTDRHATGTSLLIERSYVRLSSNEGRRLCDALEEIRPQTRPLLLVPGYGGSEFFASRR